MTEKVGKKGSLKRGDDRTKSYGSKGVQSPKGKGGY